MKDGIEMTLRTHLSKVYLMLAAIVLATYCVTALLSLEISIYNCLPKEPAHTITVDIGLPDFGACALKNIQSTSDLLRHAVEFIKITMFLSLFVSIPLFIPFALFSSVLASKMTGRSKKISLLGIGVFFAACLFTAQALETGSAAYAAFYISAALAGLLLILFLSEILYRKIDDKFSDIRLA